ncbi:hypothetical protein [Streptosporangium roseum]|uniref:Uncharacterized protein n=1 Tax=Streptosporangium roseum (strain ATCC 12428 / DSM 43021 / JCM 3005 / KCTC 9067 / NCIMB 10171 / NRRL 2505 / NI 9100) TaxID=479432 RepID=D2BF35_STRRD|nr:hypothetical protein [Streptosporangium roseum]ACZ86396.1 hypothetical protein Sros_3460 [Streptosporangium roseum DSM 43021]
MTEPDFLTATRAAYDTVAVLYAETIPERFTPTRSTTPRSPSSPS